MSSVVDWDEDISSHSAGNDNSPVSSDTEEINEFVNATLSADHRFLREIAILTAEPLDDEQPEDSWAAHIPRDDPDFESFSRLCLAVTALAQTSDVTDDGIHSSTDAIFDAIDGSIIIIIFSPTTFDEAVPTFLEIEDSLKNISLYSAVKSDEFDDALDLKVNPFLQII